MPDNRVPESAKYFVTVMPLTDTEGFPEVPDLKWHRVELFAYKKDITRIFDGFQNEAGFRIGKTSFTPKGFQKVKVYFDTRDTDSLFIVAESKDLANEYVQKLGLRKPYSAQRARPENYSFPVWKILILTPSFISSSIFIASFLFPLKVYPPIFPSLLMTLWHGIFIGFKLEERILATALGEVFSLFAICL